MRDQNTNNESLFVDTIDSNTFADIIRGETGKARGGVPSGAGPDFIPSDMALEDILDVQNLIDMDNHFDFAEPGQPGIGLP